MNHMRRRGRLVKITAPVLALVLTTVPAGSPAGAQVTERDDARAAL